MIVDSHAHLFSENSDPGSWFIASAKTGIASMNKTTGLKGNAEELYGQIAPELFDMTGDKLASSMDSAGTDRSLILHIDLRLLTDEPAALDPGYPSIEQKNRTCFEATRRHTSPSGIQFSKEEIEIFLGGAAARLYGWE